MIGKFLCAIGWHKFRRRSSHKDPVKKTGNRIIFFIYGIQKGIKKCLRLSYDVKIKVWRQGWFGDRNKIVTRWKRLSKKKEDYIDMYEYIWIFIDIISK